MVIGTENACIKSAGRESVGTIGIFSRSAWVGVASAGANNACTENTYAENASCAGDAFVIGTCIVVAGIGDSYIEDTCVKDIGAIRDIHIWDTSVVRDDRFRDAGTVRDVDAITDACSTDASAINDTHFKDTGTDRNGCFRDDGAVNRLGIYLQWSRIFELKQYSPVLEAGIGASWVGQPSIRLGFGVEASW